MNIIENWWLVLKHAWSVRFMLIGLALSAAAVALPLLAPAIPTDQLFTFCMIVFVVVFSAALTSRFVYQDKVQGGQDGTN